MPHCRPSTGNKNTASAIRKNVFFREYTLVDSEPATEALSNRDVGINVGYSVGTSVALQVWAATINGDERLQELVAIATALDDETVDGLLAVARGMMSQKAVR